MGDMTTITLGSNIYLPGISHREVSILKQPSIMIFSIPTSDLLRNMNIGMDFPINTFSRCPCKPCYNKLGRIWMRLSWIIVIFIMAGMWYFSGQMRFVPDMIWIHKPTKRLNMLGVSPHIEKYTIISQNSMTNKSNKSIDVFVYDECRLASRTQIIFRNIY